MLPHPHTDGQPEYTEWLTASGLSPRTIRVYRLRVEQALDWCDREGLRLEGLSPTQLAALGQTFAASASTREQLRAALAHWYRMRGVERPPLGAIRRPKKPHHRNRALPKEQAKRLAEAAWMWHPHGTVVMFGLYMGLRISESTSAQWSRFSADGTWYTVLGKGDETYDLPVHPKLQEQLRVVRRMHRGDDWIFPGRYGGPVVPATGWKWVREVSQEAGLGLIASHVLRHTSITEVYDRTGDAFAAQEFARHKDVKTTKLYSRVSEDRLIRAVAMIDYFADD